MTGAKLTFVSHATASRLHLFPRGPYLPHVESSGSPTIRAPLKRRRSPWIRSCAKSPNSDSNRVSASSDPPEPVSDSVIPTPATSNGTAQASTDIENIRSRSQRPPSKSNGVDPPLDASDPHSAAQPRSDTVPVSIGPFSTSVPARWLLYTVPFFWGSFGPAVRLLFSQDSHPDPSIFNTERLLLSTLVYLPVLAAEVSALRKRGTADAEPDKSFSFVAAGAELGVYVFLANVTQVLGLQQTSASRAAFLVQLQTVIVPVLSGILGLDKIAPKTWLSSLVAVAGVAFLSSDKGHGTASSLTGDTLEVMSALFFSTYIIRLGRFANQLPATPLVAVKIAVQAVLSIGWAASSEIGILLHHSPTEVSTGADGPPTWALMAVLVNLGVVMWTGLLSSAAAGWAQTKGQQGVPASEAVVIFATQPLWASALAALVLGESFGPKGFAGGAMIVAATLIAAKSDEKKELTEDR